MEGRATRGEGAGRCRGAVVTLVRPAQHPARYRPQRRAPKEGRREKEGGRGREIDREGGCVGDTVKDYREKMRQI